MLNETARGVFTIAATPFADNGDLDISSLNRMTDFYLEKGATGLTILGMMGEAGKLSAQEAMDVVTTVVARAPVPIVVGVSAAGFAPMRALAVAAMDAGVSAVMAAPRHTLKTDAQIVSYYHGVAEALGNIPFVLQDCPLVTNVVVPVSVILQIVNDCPTCVMLKHEDWPGLDKISALRAASDAGARRISILCGNGGLYLPEELARGADGAMTGFSYPEMMAQVVMAHEAGDEARARDIFDAYLPLARYEGQPGIGLAIRKHILFQRGAIASPKVRSPGPVISPAGYREIQRLIARQDEKLKALSLG